MYLGTRKVWKEAPLVVTRGKVHEYLGVTLDFSESGKVKFTMTGHIENMLDEATDEMSGVAATPAANHLFDVNDKAEKLNSEKADTFHHLTELWDVSLMLRLPCNATFEVILGLP